MRRSVLEVPFHEQEVVNHARFFRLNAPETILIGIGWLRRNERTVEP